TPLFHSQKIFLQGGQFTPASGGQFAPARRGQFPSASGGQFDRILQYRAFHLTIEKNYKQMKSPFSLDRQNQKVESKIVVALERIAEAFRVLLWLESKENALSPIQIQILIFLLFHSDEKCKVSYLSQEFNMTKSTISDSVKLLLQKGLIQKFNDLTDTRSYIIGLTPTGKQTAEKSANFAFAIEKPLFMLSNEQKEIILSSLLNLIHELHKANIITIQRMCFTCVNYQHDEGQHYCKLLQSQLQNTELRIDCAEHELIPA
ncbi:MarR family winged helix-turn-helix transcriptional regulator, partial [Algoriphagus sp.]